MKFFRRILLLLSVCAISIPAISQNDSCALQISLLTCSPGQDLYSIFGHTGLRVVDKKTRTDIIYNYGGFQFDEDFYYKFVRGGDQLQYFVTADNFNDFMYEYQLENRSVIEQTLNLNCEEKQKLYNALRVNALPANRYYRYDFLFDNCSTKPRDMVARVAADFHFGNILPLQTPTFRNLIHEYLNRGGQYWSKLGIDLLLGSKMDAPVKNEQAMFLPDYLMKGFDSASIRNTPLVDSKKLILPASVAAEKETSWFTPGLTTIILLVFFGSLTFIQSRFARVTLNIFDPVFFFILGALGLLILVMWFASDHVLCDDNFNILWALPAHLPVSFFLLRKTRFIQAYCQVCAVFYLLIICCWMFLPQGMNSAFLPVAILALIRCADRSRKTNRYDRKYART